MELSDNELEKIRTTVRQVEYGSVTINIAADSNRVDLEVKHHIRFEREPTRHKAPMPRSGGRGYRD